MDSLCLTCIHKPCPILGSFLNIKHIRSDQPSEEFELTANSLETHIETHGKLILRTLSCLTMKSLDDSRCELAMHKLSMSLQLTQGEHAVSYS